MYKRTDLSTTFSPPFHQRHLTISSLFHCFLLLLLPLSFCLCRRQPILCILHLFLSGKCRSLQLLFGRHFLGSSNAMRATTAPTSASATNTTSPCCWFLEPKPCPNHRIVHLLSIETIKESRGLLRVRHLYKGSTLRISLRLLLTLTPFTVPYSLHSFNISAIPIL